MPIVRLTLGSLERPQATRVRPAGEYTAGDSIAVLRVREACRRADSPDVPLGSVAGITLAMAQHAIDSGRLVAS